MTSRAILHTTMNLQNLSNNLYELKNLYAKLEHIILHLQLDTESMFYKEQLLKCSKSIKRKIYNIERALC